MNDFELAPLSAQKTSVQPHENVVQRPDTFADLQAWYSSLPAHEQRSPGAMDYYQRENNRLSAEQRYNMALVHRRWALAGSATVGVGFVYKAIQLFGQPSFLTVCMAVGILAASYFAASVRSINAGRGTVQADTQGPTGPTFKPASSQKVVIINQVVNVNA